MSLGKKFNDDSKNVLKTSIFSLQVGFTGLFLSLTVLSNCVYGSSNFDTAFPLTVQNFVVFFKLHKRKFNKYSKKVLKTVISSLQVDLTSYFVPDYQTVLKSYINQGLEKFYCSIRYKTSF